MRSYPACGLRTDSVKACFLVPFFLNRLKLTVLSDLRVALRPEPLVFGIHLPKPILSALNLQHGFFFPSLQKCSEPRCLNQQAREMAPRWAPPSYLQQRKKSCFCRHYCLPPVSAFASGSRSRHKTPSCTTRPASTHAFRHAGTVVSHQQWDRSSLFGDVYLPYSMPAVPCGGSLGVERDHYRSTCRGLPLLT